MAITAGPTPPASPSLFDMWLSTAGEQFFVWDGTYWKSATTYQFQFLTNCDEYFCNLKQFPIDYDIYLMDLTGKFCLYEGREATIHVYVIKENTEEALVWSRTVKEDDDHQKGIYYPFSQIFNSIVNPGPNTSLFRVYISGMGLFPMVLNYKLVYTP